MTTPRPTPDASDLFSKANYVEEAMSGCTCKGELYCPIHGLVRPTPDAPKPVNPFTPSTRSPKEGEPQVCQRQYHLHVWSVSSRWVAVAQAENVTTARRLMLEEIGSNGDGSCPIREAAAKFVIGMNPAIWHKRGAEFELTESANLEESDAECDKLREEIKQLKSALAGAVQPHECPTGDHDDCTPMIDYTEAAVQPPQDQPLQPVQALRELVARMRQEGDTQETTGFPNSARLARQFADQLESLLPVNQEVESERHNR